MDPTITITIGIAALTSLAVRDRHEMTRVLLAIGLWGLGWHAATEGSTVGVVLVAVAAGVVASLVWEGLLSAADAGLRHRRSRQ